MNFSGPMSHIHICESCEGEGTRADMSLDHPGLCIECAKSLQAAIDAEKAEELLSDDEIVEALLEVDETQVVESARLAKTMLGGSFSSKAGAQ